MARPTKDGVDYFPKDTDFYEDDKVKLLRAEFGAKGMYLLDYLLCRLYKTNGYYMQWDDDRCFLVSDGAGCGCTPDFVAEVVAGCIRRSLFDERVFDMFGVLTSAGIQRRFVRMLDKRERYAFCEEYFLLDRNNPDDVPVGTLNKLTFQKISGGENSVIRGENSVIVPDNEQSKIKENKIDDIYIYGTRQNVFLTQKQFESIKDKYPDTYQGLIDDFSAKLADKGYKYPNHYEALLKWNYTPQKEVKPVKNSRFNNFDSGRKMTEREKELLKRQVEILDGTSK